MRIDAVAQSGVARYRVTADRCRGALDGPSEEIGGSGNATIGVAAGGFVHSFRFISEAACVGKGL